MEELKLRFGTVGGRESTNYDDGYESYEQPVRPHRDETKQQVAIDPRPAERKDLKGHWCHLSMKGSFHVLQGTSYFRARVQGHNL